MANLSPSSFFSVPMAGSSSCTILAAFLSGISFKFSALSTSLFRSRNALMDWSQTVASLKCSGAEIVSLCSAIGLIDFRGAVDS